MDPSTAHHQEMMIMSSNHQSPSSASLENMLVCSNSTKSSSSQQQDNNKKPRPQPDQALKCPRCDSTNTKFCYYNNYSLSQPRYFCKSCRRYWTKGGTLRNVPVGGGCRKNKRSSSSSSSAAAKINKSQDHPSGLAVVPINGLPPHLGYDTNDLSLAFARLHKQQSNSSMGFDHHHHQDDHHHFSMLAGGAADPLGNPSMMTSSAPGGATTPTAFLDALRSNFMGTQNGNFIHNGFHSSTYGFEQDHSGFQHHQEQEQNIGMSFEDVSATMKQENCTESRGEESSRVLWGFPWQQLSHGGSDHHLGLGPTMSHHELDSSTTARESWNNSTNFTSAWHGLLNSPLH